MTNPEILSQPRKPINNILHAMGQKIMDALQPEEADAVLARVNQRAFMLRPGDAVTINIGSQCAEYCIPDYRVVVTNPVFDKFGNAIIIGVQTPHFNTPIEDIEVALKGNDGEWRPSLRVLHKVDIYNNDPEYVIDESDAF